MFWLKRNKKNMEVSWLDEEAQELFTVWANHTLPSCNEDVTKVMNMSECEYVFSSVYLSYQHAEGSTKAALNSTFKFRVCTQYQQSHMRNYNCKQ